MVSPRVERLARRLYPSYRSESDLLDEMIRSHLAPRSRVLDLGCGGGTLFPYDYRRPGRRVIGVDLDVALCDNRIVDERVYASVESLPFSAGTFDLAYSRYVFEHLAAPGPAFREVARVLKPGGAFILLTPNVWHYVPLISRLTPSAFHRSFNARLRGRRSEDTFPTLYRANSRRTLARLARDAGLEQREVRMIETRPNYLMWSVVPFLAGLLYERIVNATDALSDLRVNILGVYRKPARADG